MEDPEKLAKLIEKLNLIPALAPRKTVFVDAIVRSVKDIDLFLENTPWKKLNRFQKIKKIKEYSKDYEPTLKLSFSNMKNYNFSNILFDKKTQRIVEMTIRKKTIH